VSSEAAADVRRIQDLLRLIESAENIGDSTAIIQLLAEDAVIMASDQPVAEGKAACAEFVRGVIADQQEHFYRRISYTSDEVRILGGHAFDRGTFLFTVEPKAGGSGTNATGKYFFLYARATDESWKLFQAIVGLDSSPEGGEEQ
jgi:ketosteroid isomerase-like protein